MRGLGFHALLLAGLAGVALQLHREAVEPRAVLLGWGGVALIVVLASVGARRALQARWPGAGPAARAVPAVALLLATCALGFTSTAWRAAERLDGRLPAALEGVDLWLTGTVAELPRIDLQGTRFVFEVESAAVAGAAGAAEATEATHRNALPLAVPQRVSLAWYRGFDADAMLAGPGEAAPRAGERWRLPVRLRQPHGRFNPPGFDLELWLFERGIGATGTVRSRPGSPAERLAQAAAHPVERARQAIRDAIQARVAEPATAGVLAALAIGDQASIDSADWELLRITGVAHLMSISGLHVTMFAWLAGGLIGLLWCRWLPASRWLATPLAARWGGVAAAAAYALLAGWGVPAQRTVWMLVTLTLLKSLGANWPLHRVLVVVAAVVALFDPWALLSPGFWLSFVAVGLLAASEPVHAAGRSAAAGAAGRARAAAVAALRTQAVATVGLAPLTLLFFQQVSLVGFVANLVAIPVVTLLVTPLALLGVAAPALWPLAAALVEGLSALLRMLGHLPWATWQTPAAPAWAVLAALLGAGVAVLPLPWRLRLLALPLMLPLLLPPVARPEPGTFELVAPDVGQGNAVLVRTRGHALLYDSGPAWSPEADAGNRVLVPLARTLGLRRLDELVLSHRDSDHTGGARAVLEALPVGRLRGSLEQGHPLLQQARRAAVPAAPCRAGQAWEWDGVRFEFLHPGADDPGAGAKPNARSCVLRVEAADGAAALLAGDIEAAQELLLLDRQREALRARWLLVPHHGSRTSSTAAFVAAVGAEVAFVQAAYRSRFGHPAPEVVARYEAAGVRLLRSDRCGAHRWASSGAGTSEAELCARSASRRYWHHSPAPR